MNNPASVPMAGFLRVLYFLAVTAALAVFVIAGISAVYKGPSDEFSSFSSEFGLLTNSGQADYQRDLGVIFSLLGTLGMGIALLALHATLNPLRCGLLGGGLIVFLAGIAYGSSGSSDWLVPGWALIATAVLVYSAAYIADGLPERPRGFAPPPAAPQPPVA